MRNSLKRVLETLERVETVPEKELVEVMEEWTVHSEQVVHNLNLKKMELRKE